MHSCSTLSLLWNDTWKVRQAPSIIVNTNPYFLSCIDEISKEGSCWFFVLIPGQRKRKSTLALTCAGWPNHRYPKLTIRDRILQMVTSHSLRYFSNREFGMPVAKQSRKLQARSRVCTRWVDLVPHGHACNWPLELG